MTEESSKYVIDAESAAEMARLTLQARLITHAMKGAYFDETPSPPQAILDVACGPGEWVLDLASRYPQTQIVGVDISKRMTEYAQAQAKTRGLSNATFRSMDVTQTLDFADGLFDFVNARFLFGFMTPEKWSHLVQECFRITRPGGVIRLTEAEAPIASSMASETLYGLFLKAFHRDGRALLPVGSRNFATTAFLRTYLRGVGCINIQQRPYVLDYSAETDAHDVWCQNLEISLELMAPFLIRENVSHEDFHQLLQQLKKDHMSDTFSALFFILSVWGQKPLPAKLGRGKRV